VFYVIYYVLPDDDRFMYEIYRGKSIRCSVLVLCISFLLLKVLVFILIFCVVKVFTWEVGTN
jgi:hypothetical protein